MNSRIESLTKDLKKNGPVEHESIEKTLSNLDFILPEDYLEFIKEYNGAEGFINDGFLRIWSVEELIKMNIAYETNLHAPGYFIFGSNGGGTAYAFDKKEQKIVQFEFISMLLDKPIVLGVDFASFLEKLFEE